MTVAVSRADTWESHPVATVLKATQEVRLTVGAHGGQP